MKRSYILCALLFIVYLGYTQPVELLLNQPETGPKTHQARHSITMAPGYSFSPNGNTLTAEIVNPLVNGSINYGQFVNPDNRTLNTSFQVGSTPGTPGVSPIGAASYSISLGAIEGSGGYTPGIALVYTSMGGPGVAGYGWNIQGISSIGRSPQTWYNDGAAKEVTLTYDDRFVLDGQRLVMVAGTQYGGHNTEYRTEQETFTKVISEYTSGYGPLKFTAHLKDGTRQLYGYNADGNGSVKVEGHNEVITWYISEAWDKKGNYIYFNYIHDEGLAYPAEIVYAPDTRILFYYKQRSDITVNYIKGKKVQQRLLLDKVEMTYMGNIVKAYEFKYNLNGNLYGNYSLLNEVIEYGISGQRLNSTVFAYNIPDNNTFSGTQSVTSSFISRDVICYPGDFDGDGISDIFTLKKSDLKTWRLLRGIGNGSFSSVQTGVFQEYATTLIVSDINADGKDDIIYYNYSGLYSQIKAFSMIMAGSLFQPDYFTAQQYTNEKYYDNKFNYSADFDGDGVNDILVPVKTGGNVSGNNSWLIYSFNNTSFLTYPSLKYNGTIPSWGDKDYTADFNGDGKSDIWVFDNNGIKIYTVTGNTLTQLYTSSYPNKNHHFRIGDFNGDGRADILIYGNGSSDLPNWTILLSNGVGFESISIAQKVANLKDGNIITGDFNGNGRTDIMSTYKLQSGATHRIFLYPVSNGVNFSTTSFQLNSSGSDNEFNYYPLDINGDGKTDIVYTYHLSSGGWTGYKWFTANTQPSLTLSVATNGFNHKTKFFYNKLTSSEIYFKGTGATFPVFDFQGPLNVVSRISVEDGIGSWAHTDYLYRGGKLHRQGKGFLGYRELIIKYNNTSIENWTQTSFHPTFFYPDTIQVSKQRRNSDGTLTTLETGITNNSYILLNQQQKRVFIYPRKVTMNNELTKQSTITNRDYTSTGNLNYKSTTYKDAGQTIGGDSTKFTYGNELTSAWLIGRPTSERRVYKRPNMPDITRITNRTFSNANNLVTTETTLPGTAQQVIKYMDYNTFGMPVRDSLRAGTNYRVNKFSYTNNNPRVITATNSYGHTTTFTYDIYGRKATEKDYLNNTTSYAYDNFGRVTTVTQPDGFVSTTSYSWGVSGNNCYYIQQSGNDGSLTKTWYDKLSRQLRSDVKGFSGSTTIYTLTDYNSKGQVYRVSEPTFSSPTLWNVFAYDNYGRQQSITRPSGNNTTYSYDNWVSSKVTVHTGGKTSWKVTNSQGLLTTAWDYGGTSTYTYYPDGNLKSINAPGDVPTTMEYDIAGNQVKLIDPSAGTIEYTWNAFGQLLTQKNAENKVTEYTYHPDGRVNTKITPEGTETYAYNIPNKQLTGITNPGTAVNRGYSYDSKGRVEFITETIAGTNFSTTFTYDNRGRLSTRTHPSGIVETNNYNTNGYLASISAGGATRFTVTAMNERQQITAATYGTNLTGDFGYNSYGYPTHSKARVGTTFRQAYKYEFDPVTGNLNWRQDSLRNITENFTYGGLDQLLTVTGPQNLTMNYAANGNITGKSDLGTANQFIYGNSARPYRLTGLEIDSALQIVPVTLQQISYTSFEQPNTITESPYQATFKYNTEGQRASMVVTQNGSTILSRRYAGSRYIRETAGSTTKEFTWIGGDAYTAPCVVAKTGDTTNWYYVLRDHLGTITHLVFASNNMVAGEYSFDAWGRRRDKDNWSYTLAGAPDLLVNRGFTGHEWLPWFNLYNMNGRLYDPVVGRFLSPDNYVQMPDFSQNFNRYSYCLNNPLKYNDPSGEVAWLVPALIFIGKAAITGAAISAAGYTASVAFSEGGFNNWNWGQFGKSVGIGAVSGVVTAGIGSAFGSVGSMGIGGEFARAYAHGFANGMVSGLTGGDFMEGFAAGGLGSIAGSAFMMYGGSLANSTIGTYAFSGLAGGAGSKLTGGNFWEGAATGLINTGLNHLQQELYMTQNDKLLARKISLAAETERQRNLYNLNNPYGEIDPFISIDIRVKGAKSYLKNASIDIGTNSVNADIFYMSSKNDVVNHFGWPSKQPAAIPSPGGSQIKGYLMYLKNSTNWNVVTLRFSNASNYSVFQNYLLGK